MKYLFSLVFLGATLLHSEEPFSVIKDTCTLSIENPSLSCRKTEKIRLKNGLQVLLISDPKAEKSGAALTVMAGSWQDPENYPGMAHFLEHMLFQGTTTYPEPNGYFRFIFDHGGVANAFTLPDRTSYLFSIDNSYFFEALDRFTHFFIDPLFDISQLSKELYAVDQEYAKNVENDGWRRWQIVKETGNPLHPHAKFSTGNSSTLSKIPTETMKKWFYANYSADKMYLVIYSSLPLEKLRDACAEKGQKIHKNIESLSSGELPQLFSEKQKGHILYISPIQDIQILSLEWELPASFIKEDSQSAALLAYTLSYENEGSLLYLLKKEKWIESAEIEAEPLGQSHLIFHIDLQLTEKGLQKVPDILQKSFSYLAFLQQKKIPEHLFEERKKMRGWEYSYQSREEAYSFLERNIQAIPYENVASYPERTFIPTTYNPKKIEEIFSYLSPKEGRYVLVAKPEKTKVLPTNKEKWIGGEYTLVALEDKVLQAGDMTAFSLPEVNPFIPSELTLHTQEKDIQETSLLASDDAGKSFFFSAKEFTSPEATLLLRIHSPILNGSPTSSVLTDVYLKAVSDKLSSFLCYANKANLRMNWVSKPLCMEMQIFGYSEKLEPFLRDFLQKNVSLSITEEEFALCKNSLQKEYANQEKTLPIYQAKNLISHILFPDNATIVDKKKALGTLSYAQFCQFQKELFQKTYIESLCGGNLSIQDAESLHLDLKKLGKEKYPLSEHKKLKTYISPSPVCITEDTSLQGQGIILSIQNNKDFSFTHLVALDLLAQALKEPFFTALRSNQKTAYMVNNGSVEKEKELFHLFFIQSNSHTGKDLLQRIEFFLEDFLLHSETLLPESRFGDIKKAMIQELKTPSINLQSKGEKLFSFAFDHAENFSWDDKSIEALDKLSYKEFIEIAESFLSTQNPHRIAVIYSGKLTNPASLLYKNLTLDTWQK